MVADESRPSLILACAIVNDRRAQSRPDEVPEPAFCHRPEFTAQECLQFTAFDKFETFEELLFEQVAKPLHASILDVENRVSRFTAGRG